MKNKIIMPEGKLSVISKEATMTYIKAKHVILPLKGLDEDTKIKIVMLFSDISLQIKDICIEITKLRKEQYEK